MAADPRLSNAYASLLADLLGDNLGGGTIKIYDGTIPATADTAVGAQVLLATLTFSTFGAAVNGVITAEPITADASADATGTATWARLATEGPVTVMDVTVGTSGEDINCNTDSFVTGAEIAITALTITVPKT